MAITKETKEQLDKLKVHPREPYEDVIKRLLERCK
jgi:predicted CopG family antitoxin